MRAPLSIIIPTLDAAGELPATLACLIEGLDSGLVRDLIISDGGSVDETVTIAGDAGAIIVDGPKGRGRQLRRGAQAAGGDWLLFLHADTWLAAGWSDEVMGHLGHSEKAAYFRLRFRAHGARAVIAAGWANFRSRFGLPYGDQGLLISRVLYDQVGGYPAIALMEDVAMARLLKARLTTLNATAQTSAERYLVQGWFTRSCSNIWILVLYFWGVDPHVLAERYDGSSKGEN